MCSALAADGSDGVEELEYNGVVVGVRAVYDYLGRQCSEVVYGERSGDALIVILQAQTVAYERHNQEDERHGWSYKPRSKGSA